MTPPDTSTPAIDESAYPNPVYAWWVVFVLLLTYILAYVDRQILGVLVEPIKRDLRISDTQMSLLLGFAFAMFYTIVGIPMGRLADRSNRRNIVLAGVAIWSAFTALCGFARDYATLFIARMGVGVGEACLNPAVIPLLSDYFPRHRLGRAMGVYTLGVPLGGGLATIVGGAMFARLNAAGEVILPIAGAVRPWQAMLIVIGLSGFVIVALLATVKEPPRHGALRRDAKGRIVSVPISEVVAYLRRHWVAFLSIAWPLAASALMTFGVGSWIPSFFARSFGLDRAAAGGYLQLWGVVSLVFGALGVVGGGFLIDWLAKRWRDGHLRALLLGMLLLAPGYGLFALAPTPLLAVCFLAPAAIGGGILQASGVTTLMSVLPNQMRAQVAALYFFLVNLIGAALGPTAIALLTDHVFRDEGMLRYSIMIVALTAGVSAGLLLLAGRPAYRRLLDDEETTAQPAGAA